MAPSVSWWWLNKENKTRHTRSHQSECCVLCLSGAASLFDCLAFFPAWNKTDKSYDQWETVYWWSISGVLIRNRDLSVCSYLCLFAALFLLLLAVLSQLYPAPSKHPEATGARLPLLYSFLILTLLLSTSTLLSSQSYCFWHFPPHHPRCSSLHLSLLMSFLSSPQPPLCPPPATVSVQGPYQRVLLRELLRDYNPMERPVANDSQPLTVQFSFTLMQVMDVVCKAVFAPWAQSHTHPKRRHAPSMDCYI